MRPSLVFVLVLASSPFAVIVLSSGCSYTGQGTGTNRSGAGGGGATTVTFDPTQPANVSSPDGVVLSVPANALQRNDGTAPQGSATATLQAPATGPNAQTAVPGTFHANDVNNQAGALEILGLATIHLNDSTGSALELKSGQDAALTIPTITSGGPTPIALYTLADGASVWSQQGQATSAGNNSYTGSIPHVSSWCVGIQCTSTCVHGIVSGGGSQVVAQVQSSTCPGYVNGGLAGGYAAIDKSGAFQIDGIVGDSNVSLLVDGNQATTFQLPAVSDNAGCFDVGTISGGGHGSGGFTDSGTPVSDDAGFGSSGSGGGSGSGSGGPIQGCQDSSGTPIDVSGTWTGGTALSTVTIVLGTPDMANRTVSGTITLTDNSGKGAPQGCPSTSMQFNFQGNVGGGPGNCFISGGTFTTPLGNGNVDLQITSASQMTANANAPCPAVGGSFAMSRGGA